MEKENLYEKREHKWRLKLEYELKKQIKLFDEMKSDKNA